MNKKIKVVIFLVVSIVLLEIFLRSYFGFCDNVLVQEDPHLEYIAQPNQQRYRFRNHISYNSKSMRSEEVDTSAYLILGFGDSVINGGVLTDQDSLATKILSDSLTEIYGTKVQFLNISAGSWGPDNCYAYLEKYGDFGAEHIFLFVSSHDAYDNMNFDKIVDKNKSFRSQQYSFALIELTDKYLLPVIMSKIFKTESEVDNLGINKQNENSHFNSGFQSFFEYAVTNNIPFTIYLHADKRELAKGSYNEQGLEIINFAKENNIEIILSLHYKFDSTDFRDDIHLNSNGQSKLARTVLDHFKRIRPQEKLD